MNKCFGSKREMVQRHMTDVHDVDKDQTGWTAFCEALKDTSIQTLVISDIGIGPVGLTTLAKFIPDSTAISEVNLSKNKCFDAASVKAFADVIPQTKIQTLVIGPKATVVPLHQSEVTSLDFSSQDLGPAELIMISAVMSFIPELSELNLESNPAITAADIEDLKKSHPNIRFTI